jgi:predicted amidohydrolase
MCSPDADGDYLSRQGWRATSLVNAMKVAALQAPLPSLGAADALALIRRRVDQCEAEGIAILCCPEAVVGGLADHASAPFQNAVPTSGILAFLAPVAGARLTTIVGFTEVSSDGWLYNSAAVVSHGILAGVYRKRHPAIRQSVYRPGRDSPVFEADGVRFGILICYDSTFRDVAAALASRGAQVLFVPTNNALPASKASTEIVAEARACDVALASESGCWVVRADVAGESGGLRSEGSSAITSPAGITVSTARALGEDLLVVEIGLTAV